MRVKRYVVNSLSDAVPLIRAELGKDAVILESKDVKIGGFMGMFRKRKIEVLAAVEPNNAKSESKSKPLNDEEVGLVVEQIIKASQRSKDTSSVNAPISNEMTKKAPDVVPNVNRAAAPAAGSFASRIYGAATPAAEHSDQSLQQGNKDSFVEAEKSVREEISKKAIHTKSQDTDSFSTANHISDTERFIVNELKSLRQEMITLSRRSSAQNVGSEAIQALKERLETQELDGQWINILNEELIQQEQQLGMALDGPVVWEYAKSKLYEWLEPYKNGRLSLATRIVQFVGPTGVGKTTTIAKLAANYSINESKKLALITADTYRIAAVEQLRTYANILNIPLEVVFSPLDFDRAISSLEDAELIMMDTAGRNYKSDLHVSEVNSLLPQMEQSESVLVLSVTSRTSDMKIIAEKFSKYGVRKVVFTKLDESNAYGVIFNMILMFGLTPLFITSGQNVPDDIESFQLNKYIEMLLGEPYHA